MRQRRMTRDALRVASRLVLLNDMVNEHPQYTLLGHHNCPSLLCFCEHTSCSFARVARRSDFTKS